MKRLAYYAQIYVMIISQNIKARMEYRTDFLIGFVGMIFWNLAGLLSLWVLFRSIPSIAGWTYYELIFMYGFTLLALIPYEFFFIKLNDLRFDLMEGSFINTYFKPLNMLFLF